MQDIAAVGIVDTAAGITIRRDDHFRKFPAHIWGIPIVLVEKKDSALRFCVDYCVLNKLTMADAGVFVTLFFAWNGSQTFEDLETK